MVLGVKVLTNALRHVASALALVALMACGAPDSESNRNGASINTEGWSVRSVLPSPDGAHVAFIGSLTTGDIATPRLVLAGRKPVQIGPAGAAARSAAWMPDNEGILLAYADGLSGNLPTRFAIVGLNGDVREIQVDIAKHASYGLAVSPDGLTALFPANDLGPNDTVSDLWQLHLETGHAEMIELGGAKSGVQEDPVWVAADTVVFGAGEVSWDGAGPNGWIAVLDVRAGEVVRLTDSSQTALKPSITPDGLFVLYDAFPGKERSKRGIWYVALDGRGEPVELLAGLKGRAPTLEAGGRSVLVVDAGEPGDRSQIRRIELPDGAPWLTGG